MTRKCILCQETNYKTKYSFFSAPKDAPTRKKWKEALGIPNYTVCDETYVCSKHFDDRDIISSWASGTPPHVVTIKYKKCRLRQGAVPTTKKNKKQYCVPTTRKDNQYHMHERHDDDDDDDEDEEEKKDNKQEIMKKETHDEEEKNYIEEEENDDDDDDVDHEAEKKDEDDEDNEEDFGVYKNYETKPAIVTRSSVKKTLPIPPTKINNNNKLKSISKKLNNKPSIKKPDLKNGTIVSQTLAGVGGDNNNCEEKMITEPLDIIEPANLDDDDDDNEDESAFYIKTADTQQLYYIKTTDENSKTHFTEDDIINGSDDNNSQDQKIVEKKPLIKKNIVFPKIENYKYVEDDDGEEDEEEEEEQEEEEENEEYEDDDDDDDEYPMWKKIKAETKKKALKTSPSKISEPKITLPKTRASKTKRKTNTKTKTTKTAPSSKAPDSAISALKILEPKIPESKINNVVEEEDDGMLFEDLLETYTDVTLPSGWCVLVEARGDVTTVIYAYIETTSGGIPWIKKQVFIQNDMLMRCSAGGREIDPIVYKLIKGTKSVQVTDVDDVTDIIREFDDRTVCQGTSEKINPADIDNTIGYLDGVNWRHIECLIMINHGQARCKKCNSLNTIAKRKKNL